jgi:hypothetical protein
MVGGMRPSASVISENTASIAPAAVRVWPIIDLLELIGTLAEKTSGDEATLLKEAYAEVEEEEDEHLYHTKGWARELWIESLGLPAVLPPPEEEKHVKTAIGAERARMAREKMT